MKTKTQKKNNGETAAIQKKLAPLLKKLNEKYGHHAIPEGQSLLDYLVYYLLMYNCPVTSAKKAFRAFTNGEDFVDWNEIRVTPERELREILESFKCDPSLASQIRNILTDVFSKFHDMSLESLRKESQEKCRKRLMTLEGVDKPLITWMLRISHDYKQVPLDDRAYLILIRTGVFEPSTSRTKMEKILKDLIEVDDFLSFHHVMVEHGKKTCTEDGTMKCKRCLIDHHCDYFQLTRGRHPKDKSTFEIMEGGLEEVELSTAKKKSAKASSTPTEKTSAGTPEETKTEKKTSSSKIIKKEGLNQKKVKTEKRDLRSKATVKTKTALVKTAPSKAKSPSAKPTPSKTKTAKMAKTKTAKSPSPKAKPTKGGKKKGK